MLMRISKGKVKSRWFCCCRTP